MKTPSEKPKDHRITVQNAAGAACSTPKKMAECLHELGIPVDSEGVFSLGMLFCAIRTNCDPYRTDRAFKRVLKQSITKAFGKPARRKVAA